MSARPVEPDSSSQAQATSLVLLAAVSVQAGAAIATKLFHAVGPGGAVLLRLSAAAICLLVVGRPDPRGHDRRQWLLAGAFAISLFGVSFCFYNAISRIPLGIAVTIQFLGPLAVAVIGSRRRRDLLWIGIALLGVLALGHGNPSGLDTTGVFYAVLTAAMFSAFIFFGKQVGQAFDGTSGLTLSLIAAALIAVPTGIADGGEGLLTWHSLGLGLVVGAFSTAVPYACEVVALSRMEYARFGVLVSLEPAIAALAGLLILGEGITTRSAVGIALVSVASARATAFPPQVRRPEASAS